MHAHKVTLAALAAALAACLLGGCTIIKDYYQRYTGRLDVSGREPTGYYQHVEAEQKADPVVIPPGLAAPPVNADLALPPLPVNAASGPIGEDMDVRAPRAPYRSDNGLRTQWSSGEAVVWFEADGTHGVHTEEDAWDLLGRLLERLNIQAGEVSEDEYQLTTAAADFNEFGQPYSGADLASGAPRYRQIYRLRVGRGQEGELGIATQMIASMTMLSSGYVMADLLDPIELTRFSMGFSNHIVHVIETQNRILAEDPEMLSVTLDTDRYGHACFVADCSFERTLEMLRSLFARYEWEILEDNISKAYLKVETDEEDAEFYHERGTDSFALEDGEYFVRVGIDGDKSVITLYDEDDQPLQAGVLSRIYPGFSQALIREYQQYLAASSAVVYR